MTDTNIVDLHDDRDPARSMALALIPRKDSFELADQAFALAERLAKTEFVPKGLQNRPEAVMAAILTGNDLGLSPMIALSHVYIIEGRPALSSTSMRALILAHGHEIWWGDRTQTRAVIYGQRRGSSHVTEVVWSADDARAAQLLHKENWKKYQRAMLMARATGELARAVFPDVIVGIPYTKEELEDGGWTRDRGEIEGYTAPEQPAKGGTTKKRAGRSATAPAARPPDDPDEGRTIDATFREAEERPPPDDSEPPPQGAAQKPTTAPPSPDPSQSPAGEAQAGEHMTLAQQIAMHARNAKVDRADLIKAVVPNRGESGRKLTREEAVAVIEAAKGIERGEKRLVEEQPGEWAVVAEPPDQTQPPPDDDEPPAQPSQPPPSSRRPPSQQPGLFDSED